MGINSIGYGSANPLLAAQRAKQVRTEQVAGSIYDKEKESSSTTKTIIKTVALVAGVALAIKYRKQIGEYAQKAVNYLKEHAPEFCDKAKKLYEKAKGVAKDIVNKAKDWIKGTKSSKPAGESVATVTGGTSSGTSAIAEVTSEITGKRAATLTARETQALVDGKAVEDANKIVSEFEASLKRTKGGTHSAKQKMYEKLFPPETEQIAEITGKRAATLTARETQALVDGKAVENANKIVSEFEASLARTKGGAHSAKQKMYEDVFKNATPEELKISYADTRKRIAELLNKNMHDLENPATSSQLRSLIEADNIRLQQLLDAVR